MNAARNVRWYGAFVVLTRLYFWYALFFLYFQSKFDTADVLLLEAIYYVCVVAVEVPSGYFSDKFGRVNALRISALSFTLSYALFTVADSFFLFAVAQFLFANGFAFASGSDTSFLYGSLVEADREDDYAEMESKIEAAGLGASAIAAITGGLLGSLQLAYGHAASALATAGALLIALFIFREPKHEEEAAPEFMKQLSDVFKTLKQRDLAWLFATWVTMIVLIHIPYEYYQPYIAKLPSLTSEDFAPTIATGLHAASALIVASVFGRFAARIKERVGLVPAVAIALGGIVLMIGLMAWTSAWWVAIVLLLRSAPGALLSPVLRATIVPKVEDRIRATYLSVQSLGGRLAFAATLAGLSLLADPSGDLSPMLGAGAILGVTMVLFLLLTSGASLRK